MNGYTKREVAELTQLTPRLIQFYTERGVVSPEKDAGRGRGKTRRYSKNNLIEFAIIKQLVDFGVTVNKIGEILNLIKTIKPNRPMKMSDARHHREASQEMDSFNYIRAWEGTTHVYIAIFPYGSNGFRSRVSWGETPKYALIGLGDLFNSIITRMESVMIINFGRIVAKYKRL